MGTCIPWFTLQIQNLGRSLISFQVQEFTETPTPFWAPSLFSPVAIQTCDGSWLPGGNNYIVTSRFFFFCHNTFLFIISFYLQSPVRSVGQTLLLLPFQKQGNWSTKVTWLVQGQSLSKWGSEARPLFPSPMLLSLKQQPLRKAGKEGEMTAIYLDFALKLILSGFENFH